MGKICSHCGYELKENETAPNNRCPMCNRVYDDDLAVKDKEAKKLTKNENENTNHIICPKCNYERKDSDRNPNKCPKCGIIYSDYYNSIIKKLSDQNDTLMRTVKNPNSSSELKISFKPLLIPLWILIIINLGIFSYQYIKTGEVSGTAVTPVYITGAKTLPVSIREAATLPISIEYVSGNIPVAIKSPLSTSGNVCAHQCGY